jgi:type VI secretion system protein ImpE
MNKRELATSLYHEGKLSESIEVQMEWLRDHPADVSSRMFLFELLSFDGQWDRAERQISMLLTNEAEADTAISFYIRCLWAERKREAVWGGQAKPKVLGPLTESMQIRMDSLQKEGGLTTAEPPIREAELLEHNSQLQAFEINGERYSKARDGDDLLGSILEVFAQGEYFWMDFSAIKLISSEKPKYPRDLIWLPARVETEGESGNVFIPLLYPESSRSASSELKLGRYTDWATIPGTDLARGVGLKDWYFNGETVIPLIQWRILEQSSD